MYSNGHRQKYLVQFDGFETNSKNKVPSFETNLHLK